MLLQVFYPDRPRVHSAAADSTIPNVAAAPEAFSPKIDFDSENSTLLTSDATAAPAMPKAVLRHTSPRIQSPMTL
jgi:hypothetical protein